MPMSTAIPNGRREAKVERRITAICLILLVLFWRWLWGDCWSPINPSCATAPQHADNVQHYYAWAAYSRGTLSTWLPPRFSNWTWPQEVPLIFGDTIPIASILLAPIARVSGHSTQYFSFVSLVNFVCSYLCGAWIGRHFNLRAYSAAFIGIAMALSPVAIYRASGHEALSLHAIIIFAIALTIKRIRSLPAWSALIFVALGTHAYYFPIVFSLGVFSQLACDESDIQCRQSAMHSGVKRLSILVAITILSLLVYGYIPNSAELDPGGGTWSANIFALLDSQSHSFIAKPLDRIDPYQWEGFSYLGWLGITALILSAGAIICSVNNGHNDHQAIFPRPRCYWTLITLFAVFSLGNTWFIGSHKVIEVSDDLPLINHMFSTFRATGRFMWPMYYSILLWGMLSAMRSTRVPKSLTIFFALLLLESHVPMALFIRQDFASHYREGQEWQQRLDSNQDPLINTLKNAQLFLNLTGDPRFETDSLPSFIPQAINPTIATNYKPYLARMPQNFSDLNSGKPCELAMMMLKRAGGSFQQDRIYGILPEKEANECRHIVDISSKQSLIAKDPTAVYAIRQQPG